MTPSASTRVIHIWDTVVSIEVRAVPTHVDVTKALDKVHDLLLHVDRTFSVFRPDSLVSALRRGERDEAQILWDPHGDDERDVADVLTACRRARIVSCGAFDPWSVPGGFDPSGLVKGWAAGRALRLLHDHGIDHAMVNAGGDIAVAGGAAPGIPWRIGVRDPLDAQAVLAVVELYDGSVATSGRYERGDHLHRSGPFREVSEPLSASVVGPDPALADAFATALAVAGHAGEAGEAITQLTDHSTLIVETVEPAHLTLRSAGHAFAAAHLAPGHAPAGRRIPRRQQAECAGRGRR
jgi:thiamine biosynthesis lipoprotein